MEAAVERGVRHDGSGPFKIRKTAACEAATAAATNTARPTEDPAMGVTETRAPQRRGPAATTATAATTAAAEIGAGLPPSSWLRFAAPLTFRTDGPACVATPRPLTLPCAPPRQTWTLPFHKPAPAPANRKRRSPRCDRMLLTAPPPGGCERPPAGNPGRAAASNP